MTFRYKRIYNLSKPNSLCFGKISKFPVFPERDFLSHFPCFPCFPCAGGTLNKCRGAGALQELCRGVVGERVLQDL